MLDILTLKKISCSPKFKCSHSFYILVGNLFNISYILVMGYTYTQMLFFIYLKLKFNCVSCILFGNFSCGQ